MFVLVSQLAGLALFLAATLVLALALRRSASSDHAPALSRVSHLLFWFGLVMPWTVGVFYPGGADLDILVGLTSLPIGLVVRLVIGVPLLAVGVVLMQLAITELKRQGRGAPALVLTATVVNTGVYGMVRNPMALGFYPALLGGALLTGSSYIVLYSVGIIAAHAFNLKCFEELELVRRYGEAYEDYRSTTPFILPRFGNRTGQR